MCLLENTHIFSSFFSGQRKNLETMQAMTSYHTVHTKSLDLGVKDISQWKGQWLLTDMIDSGAGPGRAQDEHKMNSLCV